MQNEALMAHSIWLWGPEKIKIKFNLNSCLAVGIEIEYLHNTVWNYKQINSDRMVNFGGIIRRRNFSDKYFGHSALNKPTLLDPIDRVSP
jgi:hypothetical protein